ncbi:hypothetical protein HHK36_014694 [Tetracentron sinense]|uniref:RRM domain-containing protein n=1 Tax=Tetracentron sinense TaxID=13715 RepID=A0A834Z4V8_TETSI|nr:hypothetical protein HHK36_014694 [Tetracentron sinense]
MAAIVLTVAPPLSSSPRKLENDRKRHSPLCNSFASCSFSSYVRFPSLSLFATQSRRGHGFSVVACLPSLPNNTNTASTKLYVSGLSFRTTEESLRNAFLNFGQLVEVNLVMDRIANRPRGFAFLRYATEEESKKAIEGMHGKHTKGFEMVKWIHHAIKCHHEVLGDRPHWSKALRRRSWGACVPKISHRSYLWKLRNPDQSSAKALSKPQDSIELNMALSSDQSES